MAEAKKTSKRTSKKTTTKKATTKKTTKKTTTKKPVTKKTTKKKVAKKPVTKKTTSTRVQKTAPADILEVTQAVTPEAAAPSAAKKSTRSPRKKKIAPAGIVDQAQPVTPKPEPSEAEEITAADAPAAEVEPAASEETASAEGEGGKKRRRRRRGGRGRKKRSEEAEGQEATEHTDDHADEQTEEQAEAEPAEADASDSTAADDIENWEEVFEGQSFTDIGLRASVVRGIEECGFRNPTKIQAELIPLVLDGADVLGQSRTGTGKTAAFGLPLLHAVRRAVPFQAVVLAPTRELAIQIADEMRTLGKRTPLRIAAVYGGQKIHTQQKKLENGPEILVATPGRLMDMKERGIVHFNNVRFAVLDEVDRMLDIGFRDDIRAILSQMPGDRQTVFVSATISPEIESLSRTFMIDPEKLVTTGSSLTVSLVEQFYTTVEPWDKRRMLLHILKKEKPELTIVFCRTKRTVDKVAESLNKAGIKAHAIHGDMYQGKRNTVIKMLRDGKTSVVVASDLAARGLDVDGITHVVNYDLPDDPEIYIHRIGRTARAGRHGVAWAFVCPDQGELLTSIEMLANTHVEPLEYDDFEPGPIPSGVRREQSQEKERLEKLRGQSRMNMPVPRKVDETRFPGGVVPTKRPPRQIRGRVRTARSMKGAAPDE